MRPELSVVVLNWREPDRARRALLSATTGFAGVACELVAVENGSATHVDLDGLWPIASRVVLESNAGVSCGRNAGIAASTGRYVMVLDDDAEIVRGGRALLAFADSRPRAAVIGPRIVNSQDQLMFTCRRFPTLVDKVSRRVDTEWGKRALADSEFRDWDHAEPALVDYVIGACQLLRRDALDDIGLYDPSTFYGPEDVDLCLRAWLSGWSVAYFSDAVVLHDERRATQRLSSLALKHAASLTRYYARHRYVLSRKRLYERLGTSTTETDLLSLRGRS